MNTPLPRVTDISPFMGCDPEFFFTSKGEVIGAEKVFKKDGLQVTAGSKFIIDGVQAELNPRPNHCRANLANEIVLCFQGLEHELRTNHKGVKADFSRTVEITEANLNELDEQSRKFGCAPSQSIDKKKAAFNIAGIDPATYRVRAAGGHIHIGDLQGNKDLSKVKYSQEGMLRALTTDHEKTVTMLDIICGNTSVLLDRNVGNIERRKVYGRAGEFRLPSHGLEYRTLSNYWLGSYPLMSFAFGMVRLAVQLIADEKNHKLFYDTFTSRVDMEAVHEAINNNDWDLAVDNFHAIEDLICQVASPTSRYPLNAKNMKEFKHFVNTAYVEGMEYWFKEDPVSHWSKAGDRHNGGFYDYLIDTVCTDMHKKAKKAA